MRFGINRTTASTSIVDTHPELSISLVRGRPFGTIDISGLSLIGNSAVIPLGDFSTVYQVQDQLSRTMGRHTLKFGAEFRRIQSNGPLDFGVNGLFTFQDLSPFGVPTRSYRVGTPSCWFNPTAFALPPLGQFGNAGRNILSGPGFAQFDVALQKSFRLTEGTKIVFGAETYNLFNHPNFAVPSNTQSPLTLGGNGDALFEDAAGNLAKNAGRIFGTVGTGARYNSPHISLSNVLTPS